MKNTTHITTFYSYKGGVGRTMLLANVGAVLARKGRKVLLWDLDIEAPGMQNIPDLRPFHHGKGFLEWLFEIQNRQDQTTLDSVDLDELFKMIKPTPCNENLHILPAFGEQANSARLYLTIPWHKFMVEKPLEGLELFRTILQHLSSMGGFDHILIDARTGITDLGGMMTAVLPHATVLVGSYGEQNLMGLLHIYDALQAAVSGEIVERAEPIPLNRLLVISPVPRDQEDRRKERKGVWAEKFSSRGFERVMKRRIEIPFDSRLLFKEDLLVLSNNPSPAAKEDKVTKAYKKVAQEINTLRWNLIRTQNGMKAGEGAYPEIFSDDKKAARAEKDRILKERTARILHLLGYEVERDPVIGGAVLDFMIQQEAGFQTVCFLVRCEGREIRGDEDALTDLSRRLHFDQAREMGAGGMVVAPSFSSNALAFAKSNNILCFTPGDLETKLFDFGPYLENLRRDYQESRLFIHHVDQRVLLENQTENSEGVDLLEHAKKWAAGHGNRLWILLGDHGVGKTAFFKRFAYELARKAETSPDSPIPIAVDLKEFPTGASLEHLLQKHLRVHTGRLVHPEILFYLLESGLVILLFDALDYMDVTTEGGIEDQFRALVKPSMHADNRKGARILLTSRPGLFRNRRGVEPLSQGSDDKRTTGDAVLGEAALSFNAEMNELPPFDEDQIRDLLYRHLEKIKAELALKFIKNRPVLSDLARNPVFLEMIAKVFPDLMKTTSQTPADLYNVYTNHLLAAWEAPSFQIGPRKVAKILEYLGFLLWGSARNRIHHDKLIYIQKKNEPAPNGGAELDRMVLDGSTPLDGVDMDRLGLELKSIAFISTTTDRNYYFSNKSFLGFFYGRYLLTAIQKGADALAAALNTSPITAEPIEFLSGFLDRESIEDEEETDLESLKNHILTILSAPYCSGVSENALRLAYGWSKIRVLRPPPSSSDVEMSIDQWMRPFMPDCANLQRASLEGVTLSDAWLKGADFELANLEESNLSGVLANNARFHGAKMMRSNLENAVCENADFSSANMRKVYAKGGHFTRALFKDSSLEAAVFVQSDCRSASFVNASCHAARFAGARLEGVDWRKVRSARMTAPEASGNFPDIRPLPHRPAPFIQLGHGGGVNSAVYSHNGNMVLTASNDATIRLWDLISDEEIKMIRGHEGPVRSAVFSNGDNRILTASQDGAARLWNAGNGRVILILKGHDAPVNSAVFSGDFSMALTAGDDGAARLWDVDKGEEIRGLQGHAHGVNSAVFSEDGSMILTAGDDGVAWLWDVNKDKRKRVANVSRGLNSGALSKEGSRVLTACNDGDVWLWNTLKGEEWEEYGATRDFLADSGAAARKSVRRLLSNQNQADFTRSFTAPENNLEIKLKGHEASVNSCVFSKDDSNILTAGDDNTVRLWERVTGLEVQKFSGHENRVHSALFSKTGNEILTAGLDRTARIWNVKSGKEIKRFEGRRSRIESAVFSNDGSWVLTAESGGSARIWDAASGKRMQSIQVYERMQNNQVHKIQVRSAVFSKDRSTILTAGDDGAARISRVTSGKVVRAFKNSGAGLNSAMFSKDETRVLTACEDGAVGIWDVESGREIHLFRIHDYHVATVVFSKNGSQILTASLDGTARVWNAETGGDVRVFEGHDSDVNSGVFSCDDALILTAGSDGTARIWDALTGEEIRRFEGHTNAVHSAVFSGDDAMILTAGSDGTARLLNASTGEEIRRLEGHENDINSAAFSKDDAMILTACSDGAVRRWDASGGTLLDVFISTPDGWISLDGNGYYRAGGDGLQFLSYYDPDDHAVTRTLWKAEDLTRMSAERKRRRP